MTDRVFVVDEERVVRPEEGADSEEERAGADSNEERDANCCADKGHHRSRDSATPTRGCC